VKIDPLYIDARNNLGKVFLKERKLNEAIACFNEVIKQDDNLAEAHYNLGVASDRQKRSDKALQAGKNKADIYTNLGTAYTQLGKYNLAIENWAKATELKPDDAELLNNLAWLLATTGDVSVQDANKAVELAKRACELTGYNNPSFLDTLAAACAAAGRFDDAVKTAKQALDIAKSGGQEGLANEIQSHIKLYQAGQPYRQK
jgi:tetratricopeptide (TPR) repeat protein